MFKDLFFESKGLIGTHPKMPIFALFGQSVGAFPYCRYKLKITINVLLYLFLSGWLDTASRSANRGAPISHLR